LMFCGGGLERRPECHGDGDNDQRRRGWMLSNCDICVITAPLTAGTL
jgi:hypothetical protein